MQQLNPNTFGTEPPAPDMKRLLTTVVLCTAMIYGWQLINPPIPQPDQPAETDASAQPDAPAATAVAPSAAVVAATPATPDLPEERRTLSADVAKASKTSSEAVKGGYQAELSSHGAQLTGFELTGYLDPAQTVREDGTVPNIELVNGSHEGGQLLALASRSGDVQLSRNAAYKIVKDTADEVVFERLTSSGVRVTRRYTFEPARFAFRHEIILNNEGPSERRADLDLIFVGAERAGERESGGGMMASGADTLAATCSAGEEREHYPSRDLEEVEKLDGKVNYAGLDRHFFLAAIVPDEGTLTTGCEVAGWEQPLSAERQKALALELAAKGDDDEPTPTTETGLDLIVHHASVAIPPGESKTLAHLGYFGPKQVGLLQDMGHNLEENVDFGWFGVLSKPMLWVLVKFYEFLGNFGFAIIMLTVLMKLLTFPLTQKSYVSMQQMKTVGPELKELQKKYKNDRAALGQKQMDLYKEKGINPMAGCFPMLVQMPIWFALYRTLWNSVELYQQPFLGGITDLSAPESLLFGFPLLPVIVGALMFFQTTLQPPPQDQPQMKYVMWGMPIMFAFFMLQMPSGLSLYMITNSALTMAQQLYIKKKYAA